MKYFSHKQRLHLQFEALVYDLPCFKCFQFDVKSNVLVFGIADVLTEFKRISLVGLVKEALWLLYLVLNVVCFGSPPFVVTVA